MRWPQGWREVRVADALYRVTERFDPATATDTYFYVGLEHIESGTGRLLKDEVAADTEGLLSLKTRFQRGDVLFGKLRPNLNKVYLAQADGVCSTDIWVLRPRTFVSPEYAALFLRSRTFNSMVTRLAVGANLPRVPAEAFDRLPFLLPPLPEQQRIVEVLLAADLQPFHQAAEKAERLQQALVTAALGRKLTRAWRLENEAILRDAARVRDEKLGIQYPLLGSPDEWREVLLADVINSAQPGFAQRPGEEDEGTTPQIRTHNVSSDGRITLDGIKHVTVAEGDLERYRLLPGDVIFNNTNSEEWVGKTAVFDLADGVFVYSNHMTRIRVREELILPGFLATYLHFLWAAGYARNRAKRWVSQAAIDVPTLLKFKLPLPPLPEQQRIVDVLSQAEVKVFTQAIDQARHLQSALITEALSGRLTATWREQHAEELAEAARARDEQLGAPLPQLTVRITEHAPTERRTDLARPRRQALIDQLSSFQHAVWNTLRFEWRGAVLADDPAAFDEFCTSPQTAWRLEGFQAGREEVRRALEQLAAMGLIRKMSLPRANPNTGRTEYLTAFRPLREAEDGGRAEEDTALADAQRLARALERPQAAQGQ